MGPRTTDTVLAENLVTIATEYRIFLKSLNEFIPEIIARHTLAASVKRYENFWLPLKRKWPELQLLPPRDVYWIWHVHMLSPSSYHVDTKTLINYTPDHKFITHSPEVLQRSKEAWNDLYPEEQYDLDPKVIKKDFVYESKCQHDLVKAAMRESQYYYNISLPHMADETFLTNALYRYEKFLWLKQNELDLDLLSVFDIDLIWRGHMMCPLTYKTETTSMFGEILDYDSEELYSLSPSETRAALLKAWRIHFQEDLYIPGCRHRGPDPRYIIRKVTKEQSKTWLKDDNLRLVMKPEKFKPDVVLGEKILDSFGPMCLGYVPPAAEIHVDRAEHVITDSTGSHLFTLKILHTVDVHLSVLQLFHQGELVAMSHVIGHEQLVTAGQIGSIDSSVTIDAMGGERVILVKSAEGDGCLVKGGWKGYVPSKDFRNPQEKGHLELTIIKLNSKTNDRTFLRVDPFPNDDAPKFCIENVEIDMNSGEIVLKNPSAEPTTVCGQLITALSALIVYMLCEPRFEDGPMGIEGIGKSPDGSSGHGDESPGGSSDKDKNSHQGAIESEFKREHGLPGCRMLQILGLGSEVPSNNWFFWLFHRRIPEVYCPWDPDRCHRIIAEQIRLARMEADNRNPPLQALWIMLISVIVLLISVIATVLIVYYDYQLPF